MYGAGTDQSVDLACCLQGDERILAQRGGREIAALARPVISGGAGCCDDRLAQLGKRERERERERKREKERERGRETRYSSRSRREGDREREREVERGREREREREERELSTFVFRLFFQIYQR